MNSVDLDQYRGTLSKEAYSLALKMKDECSDDKFTSEDIQLEYESGNNNNPLTLELHILSEKGFQKFYAKTEDYVRNRVQGQIEKVQIGLKYRFFNTERQRLVSSPDIKAEDWERLKEQEAIAAYLPKIQWPEFFKGSEQIFKEKDDGDIDKINAKSLADIMKGWALLSEKERRIQAMELINLWSVKLPYEYGKSLRIAAISYNSGKNWLQNAVATGQLINGILPAVEKIPISMTEDKNFLA